MDSSCFKGYVIIDKITDNVYKVKRKVLPSSTSFKAQDTYILKIVIQKTHPLNKIVKSNFNDILKRSVCFSILFSELNIGPKVIDYFKCKDGYVIVTELLNNTLESAPNSILDEKISFMHELGIIHGDLHIGNIRCNKIGEPYIIDTDTIFFEQEYNTLSFPLKWLRYGFSDFNGDLEEYKQYEKKNYIDTFGDDV